MSELLNSGGRIGIPSLFYYLENGRILDVKKWKFFVKRIEEEIKYIEQSEEAGFVNKFLETSCKNNLNMCELLLKKLKYDKNS